MILLTVHPECLPHAARVYERTKIWTKKIPSRPSRRLKLPLSTRLKWRSYLLKVLPDYKYVFFTPDSHTDKFTKHWQTNWQKPNILMANFFFKTIFVNVFEKMSCFCQFFESEMWIVLCEGQLYTISLVDCNVLLTNNNQVLWRIGWLAIWKTCTIVLKNWGTWLMHWIFSLNYSKTWWCWQSKTDTWAV